MTYRELISELLKVENLDNDVNFTCSVNLNDENYRTGLELISVDKYGISMRLES